MTTLHLLDATYELFRSHFGRPPRSDPQGREVGAVHGLCRSVLEWLDGSDVTHVACATDHVVESFRNDLFDGYKSSEGVAQELLDQFPLAEDALRALGCVVWPMVEFEADDALATAVARFAAEFERVVIASPDKDLAQCVRAEHVVQWDRMRGIVRDEAGVVEKFGVLPASIPDYLGLVGDAADGIPGIKGWGAKSTSTVLAAYGTLEEIPANPSTWSVKVRGAAGLSSRLEASREDAAFYRELATLRTDVPLEEKAADLAWDGVPRDRWTAFCEALDFGSLAKRPTLWR